MNQLTVGKLADRSGVNVETMRYYEKRRESLSPKVKLI
jgi:DNA-binding transcriptional MerR regulator